MRFLLASLLTLVLLSPASARDREIVVFHAGSLAIPLTQAADEFEARNDGIVVSLEPGGSLHSARKVSDLGRKCDVFVSADVESITNLLIPDHASWYIVFASNEMALAFRPSLNPSDIPTNDTWTNLLLDPAFKFGRSDPSGDPAGYRAILTMKLAENYFSTPGLANSLIAKDQRFTRPKSADLIALLQTGAIDYAFVYRSVAVQQSIPFLRFPPELHLGDPAYADQYAEVSVDIDGKKPGETMTIRGLPVFYALTIPHNSPDPDLAMRFVEYFLSNDGGLSILERNHQLPIVPATTAMYDALPESLKVFALPFSP